MSRQFTIEDVSNADSQFPHIYANREELIDAPMWFHKRGLQQTASGYGRRLNTGKKIKFNDKAYRLYATCYSNAASVWFVANGKRIYVS